MYEKLTNDFKNKLIDRQLDKMIIISFSIVFAFYVIIALILWSIFKHWIVILLGDIVLFFVCIIIIYTIIYFIVKKKLRLSNKDYIRVLRVIKSLKLISTNDVQILLPLIKSHGINTRPKVQEAIRHYQLLLLQKSNKGFAIISILTLTISIAGIILSAVNYQSNKDLILLIILIFSLLICVTFVCIFVKTIYRSIYYNLSKYALYERIEAALSEIWMKQLI